jgi:hypothetical protein
VVPVIPVGRQEQQVRLEQQVQLELGQLALLVRPEQQV